MNDKVLKNSQDQVVRNLNPKEIKRILFQTMNYSKNIDNDDKEDLKITG